MKIRKFIAKITLLSFLISAPAAQAWNSFAPDMPAERSKKPRPYEWQRNSIVVAQNDPQEAIGGNPPTDENGKQAPTSETEDQEKSGQKADAAETKPLKPFKPSEEIAAEQAVDYPVDI